MNLSRVTMSSVSSLTQLRAYNRAIFGPELTLLHQYAVFALLISGGLASCLAGSLPASDARAYIAYWPCWSLRRAGGPLASILSGDIRACALLRGLNLTGEAHAPIFISSVLTLFCSTAWRLLLDLLIGFRSSDAPSSSFT